MVDVNPNGAVPEDSASSTTTYFQKFLLGVVTHGFSLSGSQAAQLLWVGEMATSLQAFDHFDDVIQYDWTADAGFGFVNVSITGHGDDLYSNWIIPHATLLLSGGHRGDVVDVHLIAHSRGTVVISQALTHFGPPPRFDPKLTGSYVEVTLLDAHPANSGQDRADTGSTCATSVIIGSGMSVGSATPPELVTSIVQGFDDIKNDPEPKIDPTVVQASDLWFQQTAYARLPNAKLLNLWGEPSVSGATAGLNLSCATMPDGRLIGHREIHENYQETVVDRGLVDP